MGGQSTLPGTDEVIGTYQCGHGRTHQIPSDEVTIYHEAAGFSAACECGAGPLDPNKPPVLGDHVVLIGGKDLDPYVWLSLDEESAGPFPGSNPDSEPLGGGETYREIHERTWTEKHTEFIRYKLRKRVEEIRGDRNADDLLGNCTHNASELATALNNEEALRAYIIGGGIRREGERVGETLAETRDHGFVHWWVLVRIGGECYTVDLASEVPNGRGEVLAVHGRPEQYVPLEIDPEIDPSPSGTRAGRKHS